MEQWQTIWDHEFASYGKRSIIFGSADGRYQVSVNDADQDNIYVRYAEKELRWAIFTKHFYKGLFRLSGMTCETLNLLGGTFWYELTLTMPSTITYWGDRVLVRKDSEV